MSARHVAAAARQGERCAGVRPLPWQRVHASLGTACDCDRCEAGASLRREARETGTPVAILAARRTSLYSADDADRCAR